MILHRFPSKLKYGVAGNNLPSSRYKKDGFGIKMETKKVPLSVK
jgi:hypothetical protein